MADPLVEALTRNRATYDPRRQQEMVNALARRQATGGIIADLSGGRFGQGMQKGPTPEVYQSELDNQARQAGYQSYMMERQERQDAAAARRHEQEMGLGYAKLMQTGLKMQQDKLDKQVAAISKGMEDLQPAIKAYRTAENMVQQYGEGNIPGIGLGEGGPGMIGSTLRFFQGPEAQKNFATVQLLFNKLMRGEIGSQQTIQEAQRVRQSYGATGLESEAVFREMFPLIGEALEYEQAQILSRGSGEAVEEWRIRTGNQVTQPSPAQTNNPVINFEDL